MECSNYKTIALINHMRKVQIVVLLEQQRPQVEA